MFSLNFDYENVENNESKKNSKEELDKSVKDTKMLLAGHTGRRVTDFINLTTKISLDFLSNSGR